MFKRKTISQKKQKISEELSFGFELKPYDPQKQLIITGENKYFKRILGDAKENAEKLNNILNELWLKKADKSKNLLIYKNVKYTRAFYGPYQGWVTSNDPANIRKIALSLGSDIQKIKLSADDNFIKKIKNINQWQVDRLTDKLFAIYNKPNGWLLGKVVLNNCEFFLDYGDWLTDLANLPAVALLMGRIYFDFPLEEVKDDEMVITDADEDLKKLYGITEGHRKKINNILGQAWVEKGSPQINELELTIANKKITFNLRVVGLGKVLWVTKKTNLSLVAKMVGAMCFDFEPKKLNEEEDIIIRQRDPLIRSIFGTITTPQAINNLNEILNTLWLKKENQQENKLEYQGIVFYRVIKEHNATGWATSLENYEKLKDLKEEILKYKK